MNAWSLLCTRTSQNLQKDKLITSYENTPYHARACEAIQSCGVYWIQNPSKSININRTKIPNQFDHLKKCLTDDVQKYKIADHVLDQNGECVLSILKCNF